MVCAHSAVSVIQLKRNTCKTFLAGIFMKNAKIPQLHFFVIGKHKLVTNALFKQARKSDKSLLLASQHALELMCVTVTESWLADRVAKMCQPNLLWPNITGHTKALLNKFKLELTKRHEMAISPVLQKLNHMKLKSVLFWPKCCIRGVFWGAPKFPIC